MILLTGAGGLLGAHILKEGLAQGRKIRAVVRKVSPRSFLASANVEVIEADLLDPPASLFDGVTSVIHAAAMASAKEADRDKMVAANVTMTQRLYEAAKVDHWLQVSSVATKSGGAQPIDETCDTPRDTIYAKTKRDADQWLKGKPNVSTVYPTFMLGEWDARPSTGAVFLAMRYGFLKHYVNVVKNIAAASDVAKGVWLVLDQRGDYLLGGKDVSMRDFIEEATRLLGLPMLPEGEADDPIVRELCTESRVSSEKAKAIGYVPTADPFIALREHIAYLQSVRLLRSKT